MQPLVKPIRNRQFSSVSGAPDLKLYPSRSVEFLLVLSLVSFHGFGVTKLFTVERIDELTGDIQTTNFIASAFFTSLPACVSE